MSAKVYLLMVSNVEKKLGKALFCFTFNTTLGDFRLSVVAEKMQENKRSEKFQHQMRKYKKLRKYRLC